MKNLLLGLLLIASAGLSAQTMQGQWMVGGTAGFNSQNSDIEGSEAVTSFNFSPNIGYFVIENLALGINLNIASKGLHSGTSEPFNGTIFGVGPMARYYFVNLGESAKLFGQARYNFVSATLDVDGAEATTGSEWGLGVGLAWFLNQNVALEGLVGYSSLTPNSDIDVALNTFGFNVGFQIHLGGGQ